MKTRNIVIRMLFAVLALGAISLSASQSFQHFYLIDGTGISGKSIQFHINKGMYGEEGTVFTDDVTSYTTIDNKTALEVFENGDNHSGNKLCRQFAWDTKWHTAFDGDHLYYSFDNYRGGSACPHTDLNLAVRGYLIINGSDCYPVWFGQYTFGFYNPWFIGTTDDKGNSEGDGCLILGNKYKITNANIRDEFVVSKYSPNL